MKQEYHIIAAIRMFEATVILYRLVLVRLVAESKRWHSTVSSLLLLLLLSSWLLLLLVETSSATFVVYFLQGMLMNTAMAIDYWCDDASSNNYQNLRNNSLWFLYRALGAFKRTLTTTNNNNNNNNNNKQQQQQHIATTKKHDRCLNKWAGPAQASNNTNSLISW